MPALHAALTREIRRAPAFLRDLDQGPDKMLRSRPHCSRTAMAVMSRFNARAGYAMYGTVHLVANSLTSVQRNSRQIPGRGSPGCPRTPRARRPGSAIRNGWRADLHTRGLRKGAEWRTSSRPIVLRFQVVPENVLANCNPGPATIFVCRPKMNAPVQTACRRFCGRSRKSW